MENVKSGKEVLDEFFKEIQTLEGVQREVTKTLADLYSQGKLTDTNVRNILQSLRTNNGNKN